MEKMDYNNMKDRLKLTNDLVFYLVYGAGTEASNAALTALLNVVLGREKDPIINVKVLNTVHKGFQPGDKCTVMDVKAESSQGENFDVEMQCGNLKFFGNRTLAYGAKMVNSSLAKGDDYDKMKKSIIISFIDDWMFPEIPELHTEFQLREKDWGFSLTDRLVIHFLELGKINDRKPPEEMTSLERFCTYLKYTGDDTKKDYVDKLFETGEEAIAMSERVYRDITEDESLQDLLRRQELAEHDNATRMMIMKTEAIKQGLEEGRQEGFEQGIEQGLEQGIEQGLEQGIEQGLEVGIAALIQDNLEDGKVREQIVDKLQRRFDLDQEKAQYYFDKYSK